MVSSQAGLRLACLFCALASAARSVQAGRERGVAPVQAVHVTQRQLKVLLEPDLPPQNFSRNAAYASSAYKLTLDDPLVTLAPDCQPEQIIVTQWSATSMLISWATCGGRLTPWAAAAPKRINWALLPRVTVVPAAGTSAELMTFRGVTTSYVYDYTNKQGGYYTSPYLHHVLVKGLTPGQTYSYTVTVKALPGMARLAGYPAAGQVARGGLQLTVPPARFPLKIGVLADMDTTPNSTDVLRGLAASRPQLAWIIGDLSYANDHEGFEKPPQDSVNTPTYQLIWDQWQRMASKLLLSAVPFQFTGGNHDTFIEITYNTRLLLERFAAQQAGLGDEWDARPIKGLAPDNPFNNATWAGRFKVAEDFQKAMNFRYPGPSTELRKQLGPTSFKPTSFQHPLENQYWSVEQPGMARTFWITSYIPGDTFAKHSAQYRWLAAELAATDRTEYPWLTVNFHAPWYTSYAAHYQEGEAMRQTYEPLLYRFGVDLVFNGHVHAYERSKPVYNWTLDDCGPMHVTVGNGGRGLTSTLINTDSNSARKACDPSDPPPSYQPQKAHVFFDANWVPTAIGVYPEPNGGVMCPQSQPPWSAYRKPFMGYGILTLLDATTATWKAYNVDGGAAPGAVADQVTIKRTSDSPACRAKRAAVAI